MRAVLKRLYYGKEPAARYFRFGLLGFDLITVAFFIASSALEPSVTLYVIDYVIALVLIADFVARGIIFNRPWRFILQITSILDLVVILSLLLPAFIDNLAFLRIIRMLRLLRSYHIVRELREIWPWFRQNQAIIESAINLVVFVFVVTAIVLVVEQDRNPQINHYLDALYFTVTTLTTTGFGDITMTDTAGRLLAVLIMVVGVSLFLRLVQTIFRPPKVLHPCPDCGLKRHDPDAIHCKHCGHTLKIATEGEW